MKMQRDILQGHLIKFRKNFNISVLKEMENNDLVFTLFGGFDEDNQSMIETLKSLAQLFDLKNEEINFGVIFKDDANYYNSRTNKILSDEEVDNRARKCLEKIVLIHTYVDNYIRNQSNEKYVDAEWGNASLAYKLYFTLLFPCNILPTIDTYQRIIDKVNDPYLRLDNIAFTNEKLSHLFTISQKLSIKYKTNLIDIYINLHTYQNKGFLDTKEYRYSFSEKPDTGSVDDISITILLNNQLDIRKSYGIFHREIVEHKFLFAKDNLKLKFLFKDQILYSDITSVEIRNNSVKLKVNNISKQFTPLKNDYVLKTDDFLNKPHHLKALNDINDLKELWEKHHNIIRKLVIYSRNKGCSKHENYERDVYIACKNHKGVLEVKESRLFYCKKCKRYFTYRDYFEAMSIKNGKLIANISYEDTDYYSDYDDEHFIYILGYNVKKTSNLSAQDRHMILKSIIENRLLKKSEVVAHLQWLIGANEKNPIYKQAIAKWRQDLSFLQSIY